MSEWLARALALTPSLPPVSETIKTSETPPAAGEEAGFGGFGGFEAGGPHRPEAPPAPALDGPPGWREKLAALDPDTAPCPGFRLDAWARVQANGLDFLHRHGAEAERHGWTDVELFGVHPVVGVIRVDHVGALMLAVGGRVESVEAEAIRYAGGLVYRRSAVPAAAVPIWTFGCDARQRPPLSDPSRRPSTARSCP
jgi:hypothetical protein